MHDYEFVGYLQKHLVPIYFELQKDTDTRKGFITTFILSVTDQWFLITAGHCIEQIEQLIQNGYEMKICRLVDSMGLDAKYHEPLPFNYEEGKILRLDAGEEFSDYDYAAIPLSLYYRRHLEKNNNQALDENTWKHFPHHVNFYTLLGVPGELAESKAENTIETALIFVNHLPERPAEFSQSDPSLFYGNIELGDQLSSIKGMSGGPIFAFFQNEEGEMRYWLEALQSNWNPNTGNLVACPIRTFGFILAGLHQSKE